MPRETLSLRHLFIILFVMRSTVVISTLPVLTSADALQDAWLSVLLSYGATAVLVGALALLGRRFPRETFTRYSIRLLGPWLGRGAALAYLWLFLFFAALEARIYGEVIITGFLPETPLVFVVGSMVFAAAVAAYAGVEVIGRVADIIFPLFLIAVVLTLLLPLPAAEFANLAPALARGWGPALRGALTPTALAVQFTVIAFLAPALDRPDKAVSRVLAAVACSFLVLLAALVTVVSVLGAEDGARSVYPVLRMVRSVRISAFLERVESLTVFAWGLGVFAGLAVYLYAGAIGVAHFFGLKRYRPLVPPMTVIWVVLAVHILEDVFELRDLLEYRVMGPYGLALLAAPLALLWAVYGARALLKRLGLPGGLPEEEKEA